MKDEFNRAGPVLHLLLRFTQALITQMSQTAVCNRHHSLDQQLCRWLLLSLDRLHGSELVMTQELIANMLGVRREGVTEAALKLQKLGLIRYARPHLGARPQGLEQRAASAMRVMKEKRPLTLPCRRVQPVRKQLSATYLPTALAPHQSSAAPWTCTPSDVIPRARCRCNQPLTCDELNRRQGHEVGPR